MNNYPHSAAIYKLLKFGSFPRWFYRLFEIERKVNRNTISVIPTI